MCMHTAHIMFTYVKKTRHISFVPSSLTCQSQLLHRIFLECFISQGRTQRSMHVIHSSWSHDITQFPFSVFAECWN